MPEENISANESTGRILNNARDIKSVGGTDVDRAYLGDQLVWQRFQETDDPDYIYSLNEDGADIIFYIGAKRNPIIPLRLGQRAVKRLYAVSFNYSSVENVIIPEGIEEID